MNQTDVFLESDTAYNEVNKTIGSPVCFTSAG